MRAFHFVIKKSKRALKPDSFYFFSVILTFFLCIKILIVTPLAIQYSQNVFRGISILVCIGVQVLFPFLQSSSRAWFALLSSFALASVWPKNAEKLPVLQIQSSSMKLRVHGVLFLVFLHIKADGKKKLFLWRHQNSDMEVFHRASRE